MSSKHKTELIRQLVDQALHHQKTKNLVRTITYENFDIHITSAGQRGAYHITATYQQGAGDTAINQLDVDAPDFQEQLQFIEDFAAEKQDLKAFGKRLFDFVFTRGISHLYVRYREALLDSGKGLRLRLQIDPPELNVLPWEYLYDESSDTFIAKQTPTPIVRYIQQPYTPSFLSAAGKLKILIVIASPGNYPTLDIEFEKSKIVEALAYIQTKVEIKFLEHATSFTLFQEIQNFDPHAFHFIGHGRYKNGEGSLLLEGQDGQAIPLAADQLADLLYNRQTKIVILNACQTAAKSEHASAFNSVAQALVYKRIPAVFAMQFAVPDSLAVLFSQVLYEQLAIGKPLDQAVTEMRIAASVINGEEHGAWGIPVLYMRAPDGYLWQDEEKQTQFLSSDTQTHLNVDAIQTAYVEWLAGQIGTVMLPTSQHGKRLHLGAQLEDIFTPPTFMTAQGTCSCTKLFENRPLIAFTGTLGSGKSMMLRYCAWIACQAVITQTFASTQNILGLPTTNQTAVPLPLLFPISEFAHRPPEKQALGLWAFMTDYLAKQSNIEHLAELLEGLFQHSRPLLFLLDGLDEIAEPQKLEEVRQELHSLLIGRANVYAAVTYRSSALPYINLRSDFYPYTIQGLSNAERQPFLQQTIKALSKNNTSTNVTEKATVFWEKLQRVLHQRIRNRGKHAPILEDNPLFLHTFLSLYLNTDNLRRFDRFDALTYLLILASYHWHDPTKLKIQGFIGSGVDTYIGILQKIAFESYFQEEEITEPWLLKILQQDGEGGRYAPYIERFLHVSKMRGTILTWQQDRFVFNHPGFHAYFAARHLFELYGKSHPSQFGEAKATQLAAVFLPDKLLQQKWLEVFLLVAAYLDLTDNAVKPVDNQAQFLNVMLQHADRMSTQQPNTATAILTACTLARSEVIGRNSQLKSALQRRLETFFNNREQMRRNTPPRITEAGYSWSVLGDNRRSVHFLHAHSAEFCFIPAGEYQSATERLIIPYAYWLGRYPITQKQFNEFIRDRGYQTERFWPEVTERNQWQDGPILNRSQQPHQQPKRYQEPFNLDHYPVVGLTWFESLAYSRWLTEKAHQYRWLPENWQISLASEQEWVKAARGGLNIPKEPLIEPLNKLSHISPTVEVMLNPEPTRVYPWGNQTQPHLANHNATNLRETNTVGCFIDGRSPYGCEELCGNVWEWLRDQARGVRFTKGGSFIEPDHMMQIDYRKRWHGLEAHKNIGLRLALFPSDI